MMTHPERDVLLAHADDELDGGEARAVESHVDACPQCRTAVASLRDEAAGFASLLHVIDVTEPAAWHESSTVGDVIPLPRQRDLRRPQRTLVRWAAGIFLTTAAAASAAIVALDVWPRTATTDAVPAAQPVAVDEGVATVIAEPAGGALDIALSNAGAGTRLHIALNDDAESSVAVTGTDAPRFTATAGRVNVVLGAGTSAVRVTVPRTLSRVEITLDGIVVSNIAGDAVTPAEAASADGITLDIARMR